MANTMAQVRPLTVASFGKVAQCPKSKSFSLVAHQHGPIRIPVQIYKLCVVDFYDGSPLCCCMASGWSVLAFSLRCEFGRSLALNATVFDERERAKQFKNGDTNEFCDDSITIAAKTIEKNDVSSFVKPDDRAMFAFHPHSVLSNGWAFNGAHHMSFEQDCRWLVAESLFWFPVMRDLLNWMDFSSVAKSTFHQFMSTGQNVCLIPGGFEETTLYERGKHRVYIKKRFGFIKLALQYSYKVHPVYTFGEDTYHTFPFLLKLRLRLNKFKLPGVLSSAVFLPALHGCGSHHGRWRGLSFAAYRGSDEGRRAEVSCAIHESSSRPVRQDEMVRRSNRECVSDLIWILCSGHIGIARLILIFLHYKFGSIGPRSNRAADIEMELRSANLLGFIRYGYRGIPCAEALLRMKQTHKLSNEVVQKMSEILNDVAYRKIVLSSDIQSPTSENAVDLFNKIGFLYEDNTKQLQFASNMHLKIWLHSNQKDPVEPWCQTSYK
ncbi:unnamed protein product [Phytophthora lilii]|uniref:Acyltransferase n=1 Tax=Phytophthora lilii TaxID=2077276 RepID=A0A9W6XRZ4_9STRA|nr:unnamed protein product [Phytophthora lilii]